MTFFARTKSCLWIIIPILSACFLAWTTSTRMQRVAAVTALGYEAEPAKSIETSLTLQTAAVDRHLIIPGRNNESYQWIIQAQELFARKEWRVRHADYDNAPFGREVHALAPYRWWLALVAWGDHVLSGRTLDSAVERAALWADPILQGIALLGGTLIIAIYFGPWSAAVFSVATVALFPFAVGFTPGAPDHRSLAWIFVLLSILPLLIGVRKRIGNLSSRSVEQVSSARRLTDGARNGFFAAGLFGGLGLWIDVSIETPVLFGIILSAFIAAWIERQTPSKIESPPLPLPWLAWSLGGGSAVFISYLIEYAPSHLMTWQLRVIHPLYGIAWIGIGFLLTRAVAKIQKVKLFWNPVNIILSVLALAAIAAFPIAVWKTSGAWFNALDLLASRLTKLFEDSAEQNLWAWIIRDGLSLRIASALLPVVLAIAAGGLAFRRTASRRLRLTLAMAVGPAVVALGYACSELSWWNVFDVTILLLLVPIAAEFAGASLIEASSTKSSNNIKQWSAIGLTTCILLISATQVVPPAVGSVDKITLDDSELKGLIDRDLGRWLVKHAGNSNGIVLAPPNQTIALYYYAGLRGLGTLYWENVDGVGAAVRILSASTTDEAQALIERRGVTQIVIPSWDSYLDQYAQVGSGQVEGTFLDGLHRWVLPDWLRPVSYFLPAIPGFEGQSIAIFEVVEPQNGASAMSRLAEYFIEQGRPDLAGPIGQDLRKYPADLGALIARAEIEMALNDDAALTISLKSIIPRLANGGDRFLAFDRRAGLAVVLARAKQIPLARDQLQQCFQKVDEAKLRSLSTGVLYRLQVLGKAFDQKIADPKLYQLARDLLTPDLRSRL